MGWGGNEGRGRGGGEGLGALDIPFWERDIVMGPIIYSRPEGKARRLTRKMQH